MSFGVALATSVLWATGAAAVPQLGVAKRLLSSPTNNGNGSYSLTYRIFVENSGDETLTSLQVVDGLGFYRICLSYRLATLFRSQ